MRVVFLSHSFPRATGEGVDMVLARRARELMRHASVVAVVPTPAAPWPLGRMKPRWARYAGTPRSTDIGPLAAFYPRYVQLPGRVFELLSGASMALGAIPLMRRLVRESRPDVLFAQSVVPDGLAAVLLGRWFGIPVACLARGLDVNGTATATPFGRRLTAWVVQASAGTAAVAQDLARALSRVAGVTRRSLVLHDGIDLEQFSPGDMSAARRALGLRLDGPVILYVGRLAEGKGLHCLLAAFSEVARQVAGAQLVLVGSGSLKDDLERKADELSVRQGVHFTGEQPYDLVPKWMQAANAVVLPSESEGFPNVIREALACGRPVVATPVGDIPTVVTPETGRLVQVGDVRGLAAALLYVIDARWDSAAIRRGVSLMTWPHNAAATYDFLRDAIARGRS